ncbi:hypothetical protein [Nocardia sp. NPDC057227]|uniref:hypothetical protein n=1 Tax=Nocardia sp. NPDC057227 TaxID=3346056 RepID=UPI003631882D
MTERIEEAYDRLKSEPEAYVRFSDLREALGSRVSRAEFDAAVRDMAAAPGAHIHDEADQKTLKQRDLDDAVVLGGTRRHNLLLETSYKRSRRKK